MNELPFIIVLVGSLIGISVIYGIEKKWAAMGWWIFTGVSLGLAELTFKLWLGKTISQMTWEVTVDNPILGALLLICLGGFFLTVWIHLAWKWLTKKKVTSE